MIDVYLAVFSFFDHGRRTTGHIMQVKSILVVLALSEGCIGEVELLTYRIHPICVSLLVDWIVSWVIVHN